MLGARLGTRLGSALGARLEVGMALGMTEVKEESATLNSTSYTLPLNPFKMGVAASTCHWSDADMPPKPRLNCSSRLLALCGAPPSSTNSSLVTSAGTVSART